MDHHIQRVREEEIRRKMEIKAMQNQYKNVIDT